MGKFTRLCMKRIVLKRSDGLPEIKCTPYFKRACRMIILYRTTMYEQQTGIVEIAEQFHEANVTDKNDAHLSEFENLSFSLSFGSLPHAKEEREEMAEP
uniref:Uncharacterized protein n=1 Tax=Rhodnius prolixus TaxID=13249 RepID=T1HW51_RHOPR